MGNVASPAFFILLPDEAYHLGRVHRGEVYWAAGD
jgi:hypothetical protein